MPLVGEKFSSVWLGGQDVAKEGRWVWTSAGNQPLAKDLMWELGKVYAYIYFYDYTFVRRSANAEEPMFGVQITV